MVILGFWHIANVGGWGQIWPGQLTHLKESGLYEATRKLHVGLAGEMNDSFKSTYDLLARHEKLTFRCWPNREVFEFPTLGWLHEKSVEEREPFLAYYIHVKGACTACHQTKNPAYWWKEYMEHYVVERWKDCASKLKEGYEVVGVEWRESPAKHFSGNFFWARSEYLRRLPDMDSYWSQHHRDRVMAEMYMGRASPKYCELKRYGQDLYRFAVTPDMWD